MRTASVLAIALGVALGARVLATYPMLNLLTRQSLGVALFSYAGRLHWGFIADWDLVPDLHDFVVAIERAFGDLCEAAELPRPATRNPHVEPDDPD